MSKAFPADGSKLKYLVAIEIALIVLYRLSDVSRPDIEIEFWKSWIFMTPLAFGLFTIFYAFNIRCKNPACNAGQVFRGWSAFDMRWPSDTCYKCGRRLRD